MATQIEKCQAVDESASYTASIEYGDRRTKLGHRQQFCKTCQRWKYLDEWAGGRRLRLGKMNYVVCPIAVLVPRGKCIRCEKKRPAKDECLCRGCIEILKDARMESKDE